MNDGWCNIGRMGREGAVVVIARLRLRRCRCWRRCWRRCCVAFDDLAVVGTEVVAHQTHVGDDTQLRDEPEPEGDDGHNARRSANASSSRWRQQVHKGDGYIVFCRAQAFR